jgi:Domain of unknown function (DUF6249)
VREQEVVLIILTLMIFGGLFILWMAMTNRRALREMEHRERIAMIQRGLMPAPESDPMAFEAQFAPSTGPSERWRAAGVIIIGLGLALMFLLTFTTREPELGIGVGGAFVALGATFVVNAAMRRAARPPYYPTNPGVYRSQRPPDPPGNV